MRQSKIILRWFAGGIVFLVLGFTALNLYNLQSSLGGIHTVEKSKPAWVLSRLEFEYLRFMRSLPEYKQETATANDVVLRFDILWSRLGIVQTATTAERLAALDLDLGPLTALQATLDETEGIIAGLDGQDTAAADALIEAFGPLEAPIRNLTLAALEASSAEGLQTRQSLVGISSIVNWLTVLTVFVLIVMMATFAYDARVQQRISEENLRLLKKSYAASEAKSQFISVINHELRTPLTSISGALGLIRGGAAGEINAKVNHLTEIALRNCDSLTALVCDLLDIDKAHAGQLPLTLVDVDADELVTASIADNAGYAQKHGVQILHSADCHNAFVRVDTKRMMQVMANLLSNAIKFSGKGSTVEVAVTTAGGKVSIAVRDHGIGIPEDALEVIFERFYQVDNGIDRKVGGTGLGLGIARGIVEGHGGVLTVQSTPGEGSTFTILLDRVEPPVATDETEFGHAA